MTKVIFILLLFSSCALMSQEENSFQDYLSHFKEKLSPQGYYSIESDSLDLTFEKGDSIPSKYISLYIDKFETYSKWRYRYLYGTKVDVDNHTVVFILRDCDYFPTKWGRGVKECFAIVYSKLGERISKALISMSSDGQAFHIFGQQIADSCFISNVNLLGIGVTETFLRECVDEKAQIYQGAKYSRDFSVNRHGLIQDGLQMKLSDVKVARKNIFEIIEEHEVWQDLWIKFTNAVPYNDAFSPKKTEE